MLRGTIFVAVLASLASAAADDTVASKPDRIKVAAVQISGYDKGDVRRDGYDPVPSFVKYIDRAGADGAQLVVFPEYVLGHITVPGPETEQIAAAAKRNSIYVIIGCWENYSDDRFANTALIFGLDGNIAGKYHKTHAAIDHWEGETPWERPLSDKSRGWMIENDPEWIMEAGTDLPVFECDFGTIGIMTCYDGWFPEPPRIMSLKGAELIVWINGRGGSVEDFIVRTIMFQSHVAVIATNQAYGSGTMIGDCSARPNPILARSPDKEESYITAEINLQQIRHQRHHSRNFRQRRPDLYAPLADGQ